MVDTNGDDNISGAEFPNFLVRLFSARGKDSARTTAIEKLFDIFHQF